MITEVIKGVDSEIEFKGFFGQYFYLLASAIVGGLVLTFFLYIIGFSSIIVILFMLALVILAVFYIKNLQNKYGKYGRIQAKHSRMKPNNIILDKDFKILIKRVKE
jgi:Domain of unknown function (DUF4133)